MATTAHNALIPEQGVNAAHEPNRRSETERGVSSGDLCTHGTSSTTSTQSTTSASASANRRIIAEIQAGLRHGYFDYSVTCEVIGRGRRRLVLRAGKSYQFVIPAEECEPGAADV